MDARLSWCGAFVTLLAAGGLARATDFTDYEWTDLYGATVRPTELMITTCGALGDSFAVASFVAPLPGTFTMDLHYEVGSFQEATALWIQSTSDLGFLFDTWCTPGPCGGDVSGIVLSVAAGDLVAFNQYVESKTDCDPHGGTTCTITNLQFHPMVGIQPLNGGLPPSQFFDYDPGEEGTGSFVAGLAALGDVNGDGLDDWACGLPNGGEPYGSGMVQILSGDGSLLHEIKDPAFHQFGAAVAGVGDLDGDGADDLAVTEAGWPGPTSQEAVGRVHVFSGATATPLFVLDGTQLFGEFGSDIDGAGDMNGDGVGDILVGARAEDGPAGQDAGAVRVYSGVTQALLFEAHGDKLKDVLGSDVTGTGDVDGDGLDDFAACAPGKLPVKSPGLVRVWSSGWPVIYSFPGVAKTAPYARVDGAGDVDADGRPDILIGAPYAGASGVDQSGSAILRSGATGEVLFTVSGGEAFELLGHAVSRAGDLNGDGFGDLLVTAPGWHEDQGRVLACSGLGGQQLFEISSHMGLSHLGNLLAGARDLDGDTTPDVLASSWYRVLGNSGVPDENVVPQLEVEGSLVSGSPLTLSIAHGPAGGTAALVVGLAVGNLPFKGGLLVPSPDRVFAGLPLQGDGSFVLQTNWPAGLTSLLVVQAWMPTDVAAQGFAASDAVVLGPP